MTKNRILRNALWSELSVQLQGVRLNLLVPLMDVLYDFQLDQEAEMREM